MKYRIKANKKMSAIILILFILSASVVQIRGQNTRSQTIGDDFLYAVCGRLCDKPDMDAITPLSVSTDKQFLVLIVRDSLCSFILDVNNPEQNRVLGRRHHFKYDKVEALYTIFDDIKSSDKYNVTALFTSGMVSEIWRSVNGYIKKDSDGPLPLMGLGYNMQSLIDASYGWQPDPRTRIVRIIQNDSYYSFDLKTKRRVSGPDSLNEDFSYDYKKLGKLHGAFSRGKDILFFSGEYYYIWRSKDGKKGVLGPKRSITKDLYDCDTRYTTPKVKEPDSIQYQSNLPIEVKNFDKLTQSNSKSDVNNKEIPSQEVAPKKVPKAIHSRQPLTPDADITDEPKTVSPKPNPELGNEGQTPVNANIKVLLSIEVLLITMALIYIL